MTPEISDRRYGDWGQLWARIDQITQQVQSLAGIVAAQPTWADLRKLNADADLRHVDRGVYEVSQKDVIDQIAENRRLIDAAIADMRGSWSRLLPWLSLTVSGCSTLLTFMGIASAGLIWLIAHAGGH